MEFISLPFVACMVLTFVLYYAHSSRRWQHIVLLLASCVFIGYYHLSYLLIAVAITIFTFVAGKWIHRSLNTSHATLLLWVSIVALVGFWLVARYWFPLFPLGISFYTFQALSYLIEIYWEEEPEDDFWDFSLYMLLFVKFLSGPIERAFDLLPQLKKPKVFAYESVTRGLKLIAWGVFLKLVIADRIGPSLDIVLDNVHGASGMQLLVATLLYPIQLYADFAGYTCMALGLGRMLGFELKPNFDRPFVSQSTGELWRRWHMTLSFWVRDYVFTPLNASLRKWKRWGVSLALLVTFVAIGVWHGAGWTFALYGLFQGIVIIYETLASKQRNHLKEIIGNKTWKGLMIVRTYLLFALSLLFFRVSRIGDVFYTYRHLFDGLNTSAKELRLGMTDNEWVSFGIAVLLMFLFEFFNSRHDLFERSEHLRPAGRWACYLAVVILIFLYGNFGIENFIYIQF
ncbi:MAG: MBOAT family protein [Prevotella sp.]|jgi:alginate O-acetyltransferase complex protein AlgI|nr:MBOAT family protein [Prevotella sp.]MCI1282137.1 MBOAT family protein [Prevotella sp.]